VNYRAQNRPGKFWGFQKTHVKPQVQKLTSPPAS